MKSLLIVFRKIRGVFYFIISGIALFFGGFLIFAIFSQAMCQQMIQSTSSFGILPELATEFRVNNSPELSAYPKFKRQETDAFNIGSGLAFPIFILIFWFIVLPACTWLIVHGRKCLLSRPKEFDGSQSAGHIVYLRCFNDDRSTERIPLKWFWRTEEEILFRHLKKIAPIVAIGRPGEGVPPLGAERCYVSDEQWKNKVMEMTRDAKLIVLRLGTTEGLSWEIIHILTQIPLEKLVFVVPYSKCMLKDTINILYKKLHEFRPELVYENQEVWRPKAGTICSILAFEGVRLCQYNVETSFFSRYYPYLYKMGNAIYPIAKKFGLNTRSEKTGMKVVGCLQMLVPFGFFLMIFVSIVSHCIIPKMEPGGVFDMAQHLEVNKNFKPEIRNHSTDDMDMLRRIDQTMRSGVWELRPKEAARMLELTCAYRECMSTEQLKTCYMNPCQMPAMAYKYLSASDWETFYRNYLYAVKLRLNSDEDFLELMKQKRQNAYEKHVQTFLNSLDTEGMERVRRLSIPMEKEWTNFCEFEEDRTLLARDVLALSDPEARDALVKLTLCHIPFYQDENLFRRNEFVRHIFYRLVCSPAYFDAFPSVEAQKCLEIHSENWTALALIEESQRSLIRLAFHDGLPNAEANVTQWLFSKFEIVINRYVENHPEALHRADIHFCDLYDEFFPYEKYDFICTMAILLHCVQEEDVQTSAEEPEAGDVPAPPKDYRLKISPAQLRERIHEIPVTDIPARQKFLWEVMSSLE